MGTSHGDFIKYPRTPHLFGSKGTDDDKHLGEAESSDFIIDDSLIVEEKIDGTNVGIHFSDDGNLVLQCRGHLITEGMHPQYDLFKQWATVKRYTLEERLGTRFILFGEWVYARHSVFYRQLTHYFFEFDIYDKESGAFLDLEQRLLLLDGANIETVPVVHVGALKRAELEGLIGPSRFDSQFENPVTNQTDNLMEGLYLRPEASRRAAGGRSETKEVEKRRRFAGCHLSHSVVHHATPQLVLGPSPWIPISQTVSGELASIHKNGAYTRCLREKTHGRSGRSDLERVAGEAFAHIPLAPVQPAPLPQSAVQFPSKLPS